MIENISTSELRTFSDCIKSHFSQLYVHDVLVSGQTTEENNRYLELYSKLALYLHAKFDSELITEDFVRQYIDEEIERRGRIEV